MRRDGTVEFCHPEFGCDCFESKPESAQYVEAFKAGYGVGFTDGKATGFMDAKARTYGAIAGFEAAAGTARVSSRLMDSIRTVLGSTPC